VAFCRKKESRGLKESGVLFCGILLFTSPDRGYRVERGETQSRRETRERRERSLKRERENMEEEEGYRGGGRGEQEEEWIGLDLFEL
jgi:hypothetical protein